MRRVIVLCLAVCLVPAACWAGGTISDEYVPGADQAGGAAAGPPTMATPTAVLWDNGPLVNGPGAGAGGADASILQQSLGLTIFGFGHQWHTLNRVADDFVVPAGQMWSISRITFFGYMTLPVGVDPPPPSQITGVFFEVWSGEPDVGTLVFGDFVVNRLTSSTFSGIYRVPEATPTATFRPVMANVTEPGVATPLSLGPGTYWLTWSTQGAGNSGPWAPPITINGQTDTGNGKQSIMDGPYADAVDVGFLQGFPFIIEGTVTGPTAAHASSWGRLKSLYR